ncbi:M50 family metallopeptidase [Paenibacillus sepulcri]|uniref:M50 family metallopeptidase n=1 Tax=Paenibacillus sepulcri TaxID=359917 RepID=UPI0035EDF3A8
MLITIFLTRFIPFSAYFRNVDTLVHELSHALVTLVLSGKVRSIHLFSNGGGVTFSSYADTWVAIPIALAGYMGSALFALFLFRLYASRKERTGLNIAAGLAVIGLALFVRNGYGMAWCAVFAAATFVIAAIAPAWLRHGYYLLIAFIVLVESIISPFTILSNAFMAWGTAGDAASLGRVTFIPTIVWALLFMAFSLLCAKGSTGLLFKRGFGQKAA